MSDEMKVCATVINHTNTELLRAHATLWAASQVLADNSDRTIDDIELQSRGALVMEVVAKHLMNVYDLLSELEPLVYTGKSPEEILQRLQKADRRA